MLLLKGKIAGLLKPVKGDTLWRICLLRSLPA
jgi:hypothetical protein